MTPVDLCLATATSDSFVPGTLVLIHSFLRHNRWFRGDIVVIHRRLSAESRAYLTAYSERVVLCPCSPELAKRMEAIAAARPDLSAIVDRFLSLEAFRLRGYDRVVFLDSDILVTASIHEFFSSTAGLAACGDGAFYLRQPTTFPGIGTVVGAFNAGALSIGASLRTGEDHAALLCLASPQTFQDAALCFTDQALLNMRFAGRFDRRGAEFNYLLAFRTAIHARERIGLGDARAIHFNGPDKPWMAERALRGSERDAAFASACALWLRSYGQCLTGLSLHPARLQLAASRQGGAA